MCKRLVATVIDSHNCRERGRRVGWDALLEELGEHTEGMEG